MVEENLAEIGSKTRFSMSEIELVPDLFLSPELTHEKFSSILTFDTDRPESTHP